MSSTNYCERANVFGCRESAPPYTGARDQGKDTSSGKNPNLSLCGSVCVSADRSCGRGDVGSRVQLCMLIGEASATPKDDLSCSPLLFSLCGGDDNYDAGIQEVQRRPVL